MFTTPRPAQRQQPGQHTGQPPVPEFKRPATVQRAVPAALPSTPFAHAASPLSAAPPLSSTRPASTTSIGAGTFANATPSATGSSSSSTKVLLESDRRSLRTLSEEQVPAAVRALLDEMDLDDTLSYRCYVDVKHNLCALAFWDVCHVWSYRPHDDADAAPSFIRTFDLPSDISNQVFKSGLSAVPHLSVVAYPDTKQVGFLACSVEGHVRFWEDLLAEGSYREPHGFLYATVQGRLFNIEVSAPRGGRRALTYTQLSRPTNLLNKVSGWLSSAGLGGATPQKGGSAAVSASAASYAANDTVRIVAGPRPKGDHHLGGAGTSVIATTTDAKHVREAYLFTKSSVLGWAMARGVPERFLFEENVLDVIAEDVARFEGMPIAPVCEIIDADLAKDRRVVVLVAVQTAQAGVYRLALAWLDRATSQQQQSSSTAFTIRMTKLFNASVPESELDLLRVRMSNGGPMVYIVGRSLILLAYLHESVTFEEVIPFRPESGARVLASATDTSRLWSMSHESMSTLWVLSYPMGMLRLDVNVARVASDRALLDQSSSVAPGTRAPARVDHTTTQSDHVTAHIRSLLEQAIFFGAQTENPIAFELSNEMAQDFSVAAVSLSEEIVRAEPKQLAGIADIKISLRERANLLDHLLTCLVDNDVLERVNPSSRFQLLSNAEKMDAAIELWQYHNTLLGRQIHEKSARHLKLLEECIERLLAAHGKSLHGYTALRTFFKSHAGELAELVGVVFDTAQSYAGGKGKNSTGAVAAANVQREMIVFECNRIILALFKGALRYRGDNRDAYELDAVHGIEPWTAGAPMLKILQTQFDQTDKMIQQFSFEHNINPLQRPEDDFMDAASVDYLSDMSSPSVVLQLFKLQLVELADVLMSTFIDRLSLTPVDSPDQALLDTYLAARPRMLNTLAKWGQLQQAYELSQKYRDFYTLVDLVYAHESDPAGLFLDLLARFREAFAFELYRWHCENGQYKSLMSLHDDHDQYLALFIQQNRTDLQWLLDFKRRDFASASANLYAESQKEKKVPRKQIMLSIAKLAYFAGQPGNGELGAQRASEELLVGLDLLNIYAFFRSILLDAIGISEAAAKDMPVADTLKQILQATASDMKARRPVMFNYYCALVKSILSQEELNVEGLVDLMTLNYTDHDPSADGSRFALALELYYRAREALPLHRREACIKTILRRTLLASCPRIAEYRKVLDARVQADLPNLPVFAVLKYAHEQKLGTYDTIDEVKFLDRTESVHQKHDGLTADRQQQLYGEYQQENMLLDMHVEQSGLAAVYAELLAMIR